MKQEENIMNMKERCKRMMDELGIPVTRFCQNIHLSVHSYYDWRRDKVELSEKRLNSIDIYLKKYGF